MVGVPADISTSNEGVLILCSGRCGSTIVADLLAEHPSMLPILEFFYAQFQDGVPEGTLTGAEFWSMLNRPWRTLNTVVDLGRVPAELRYKFDDPAQLAGMSGLLGFTLPAISDEPDELLAQLGEVVPGFAAQSPGEHYHRLFDLLCELSGKRAWLEKSAGSCMQAPELLPMFPRAKVVYLVRDCVDVAISMSHHSMFQLVELRLDLALRTGGDPYSAEFTMPAGDLDPEVERLFPHMLGTDTLDERAGSFDSLMRLVMMQAAMARQAEEALSARPADQVLRMKYEELVGNPQEELTRLGDFLEIPDCAEWARRSSGRIRRPGPPRIDLDAAQRNMLTSVYYSVINSPENPLAAFI